MKNKIAVFANGWTNDYMEYVICGLREKAKADGIDIFAFVTYPFYDMDQVYNDYIYNIFRLANPADFDGAIILTNTFNSLAQAIEIRRRFADAGVPLLSLEVDLPDTSCIRSENYKGVRDLATHLIECHNVQSIIYVNGVLGNIENQTRKQALLDVLAQHRLTLTDEFYGDFSFYSVAQPLAEWLSQGKPLPDAFVCANDKMALGMSTALYHHGYKIPDDVIVTGFDKTKESQFNIPNIATVSRGWEHFGTIAYDKLMYQIQHPQEIFTETYDSVFVPGESCGCIPSPEVAQSRFLKNLNLYSETAQSYMIDRMFRRLQLTISSLNTKEDFCGVAGDIFLTSPSLAQDFCVCTMQDFFEKNESELDTSLGDYPQTMDVLYEMKDGKTVPFYTFSPTELYPGYQHTEGKSDLYVFSPLTHTTHTIGYLALKNHVSTLFDQSLAILCMDLDTVLISMQRYFTAERNKRRLEKIYMTDSLTGIYNRTGCESVLYQFIADRRSAGKRSILLFADIDNMKSINDSYGHLNGDLAIKSTADALRQCTPGGWLFARFGGDEFLAVGDGDAIDGRDFPAFLAKTREDITAYIDRLHLCFSLNLSIGYSVIEPDDPKEISAYVLEADHKMYENKKNHKR